jgi:hypothetical protein
MTLRVGQVYCPKEHPDLVWAVVAVTRTSYRLAYLSVPPSLQRNAGARPGEEFEIQRHALNPEGLERLA